MGQSFLVYRQFRHLKISVSLCLLALIIYIIDNNWHLTLDEVPNGGTILGYILGGIASVLILVLMWFGIRKRLYNSRLGTIQGWLSAHVYLGITTLFIATLHTGFQFGWNVHTLSYVSLVAVTLSGAYGVWMYVQYPKSINQNLSGLTPNILHYEISALEQECLMQAQAIEESIYQNLKDSFLTNETYKAKQYGDKQLQENNKKNYDASMYFISERISRYDNQPKQQHAMHHLLALLGRRNALIKRLQRNQWQINRLTHWRIIHIPLSFALLASLIVHIVVVFLYW